MLILNQQKTNIYWVSTRFLTLGIHWSMENTKFLNSLHFPWRSGGEIKVNIVLWSKTKENRKERSDCREFYLKSSGKCLVRYLVEFKECGVCSKTWSQRLWERQQQLQRSWGRNVYRLIGSTESPGWIDPSIPKKGEIAKKKRDNRSQISLNFKARSMRS